MAKKKKKKKEVSDFLWFANYVPGIVPTHTNVHWHNHGRGSYVWSYTINRPGPPLGWFDEKTSGAAAAFIDYTFSGPIELMAGKSAAQAGFLTMTGLYSSFRLGLAIELGLDFAIVGAVLTVADPADKWSGGLDEWGFAGGSDPNALTVGTGGQTPLMWGLKQGKLGFLFGSND